MTPTTKGAVNKINIRKLLDYKDNCNFRKFVLTYIATRLKEKDIKDLEKIFFEIDENKDGTLTYDEMKKSFMKLINEKNY